MCAVVAAVYLPTAGFGFVSWDDPLHVLENPLVVGPPQPARTHLLTPMLGYPSPLSVLSHRLERALVGPSAWLHHVDNVLLHLLAVGLVHRLARSIGASAFVAGLAALVFGLHPVGAETVSWVSGRKDLLVAVASLCACLFAVTRAAPTPGRALGFAALVALGLACKPTAAAAVGAAVVLRCAVGLPLRGTLGLVAPAGLLVLGYVPFAMHGQEAVHAVVAPSSGLRHARDVYYALGHHLALVLRLVEPCVKYLPKVVPMPFTPRVDLLPPLGLAATALAAAALVPARRRVVLGTVAAAAALYAPNSGVIPLVRFLADTYVYLPLSMLAIAFGTCAEALLLHAGARRHLYERALAAGLVVALAPAAYVSSSRYASSVTLWAHAVAHNPHDARLCTNWCEATRRERSPADHLAAADACAARHGQARFAKHRGIALVALGRGQEGLASLERAMAYAPHDVELARAVARLRAALSGRRTASPASGAASP